MVAIAHGRSCACPGLNTARTHRPLASVRTWALVVQPPRDFPLAVLFLAARTRMQLHGGEIDARLIQVHTHFCSKSLRYLDEEASSRTPCESIECGRPRTKSFGQIPPRYACSSPEKHGFQEQATVPGARALGEERAHARPSLIAQQIARGSASGTSVSGLT